MGKRRNIESSDLPKSIRRYLKSIPDFRVVQRAFRLMWSHDRKRVLVSVLFVILQCLFTAMSTYYLKLAYQRLPHQEGVHGGQLGTVMFMLLLSLVGSVMQLVLSTLSQQVGEKMGQRFVEHVEDRIHEKSIQMNMAFMESPGYYDVLVQAKSAGASRIAGIFDSVMQGISMLLNIIILAGFVISINWLLLLMLLLLNIPIILSRMHYSRQMAGLYERQTSMKRRADYYNWLMTDLHVVKETKTYRHAGFFLERYRQLRGQLFKENFALNTGRRKIQLAGSVLFRFGWFIALGYMIYAIVKGDLKYYDLTYLLSVVPQILNASGSLSSAMNGVYNHTLYARHIFRLFDLQPAIQDPPNPRPMPAAGFQSLDFKGVCFTYPGKQRPALQDVDLRLERGRIVALVGLNGSGKTTLIKLLARLYDPDQGSILIDGADIRDYAQEDYQKRFSIIFQDFARYNISVADNILIGDIGKDPSPENIEAAAVSAGADEFIRDMPEGYDSQMGRMFDNGTDISTGQWQKVAIARALFRDSDFIIMDEPTSALDATAEKRFFLEFRSTIGHRGALLISHKISAVKYADYIYVLDAGRIIEKGTHDELIRMQGNYAWLFDSDGFAKDPAQEALPERPVMHS